ncbi:hypothetical protein [Geothrix edaphica]|uniref:Uncharacterized protein n=1 Tax=Geothrix edaphica TaxID=2927976 RepID=A0ABQ5PWB8_9BACT|nr:hypothetical protein [Geothrix edaphica]GLH66469.1 hypothetical protein GETHED_08330 [Geothrix edaphica]
MRIDLQRYNHLLWAVNGTLLLVGLLVLLTTGLTALWPTRDRGQSLPAGAPATTADAPPSQAAILRLGLPKPMKGTDTLLVPVEGLPQEPEEPRGIGSYSKGAPSVPLFNLLFVDAKTLASRPLLSRKSLILRYDTLEDAEEGRSARVDGLVVSIVDSDTNGNGRLDEGDEARIWLCDASGRNLHAITATGTRCANWHYDSLRRTVYLVVETRSDSRKAESADVLAVPIDGSQPARPVASKAQIDDLRNLLQH